MNEEKRYIMINGYFVPDPEAYSKKVLALEIVKLRKENEELQQTLKKNAVAFRRATKEYIEWMEEAERQISLPIWERKKMPVIVRTFNI